MDDIQSWWEVPSIAHFCSLFRVAFNLLDFDIEELEEALLTDGAEDSGSSLLQELIVRLLCGCLSNNGISTFNYQMFLRRIFRQKCREYGRDNPFNTDIDFQFLPLRTKVEILHALCDFRLDAEDVLEVLKNLDSDSLRVHPLGYDENHSAYWYFYGTRLYREDYPKAKKKKKKVRDREKRHGKKISRESSGGESEPEMGCGEWQVVCYTESDWERLSIKMEDSHCKEERALHAVLAEDFLPEIPRLFEEKERLQRKRLLEMQPRRQSSRLEKLKHQKETEKKLAQEEKKIKDEDKEKPKEDRESREARARQARERRAFLRLRSRSNSTCDSSMEGSSSLVENVENSQPRGRQTNNSLSSATGQIIIQPSRQKLRTSQVFRQSEEDLQTGLYKILDRLKNHDDAWPFVDPVEEEYAPRYYSVIAKPMDLQRMEDKLDSGEYLTFQEFKADFKLIVDNCRQYNGSDNEYTEMAGKLQEAFESAADRYLETELSTDEEVAVEFPGEQQGRRRKLSNLARDTPPESSNRSIESEAEEGTKEDESEDTNSQKAESQTSDKHEARKTIKKVDPVKRTKKAGVIKNVADIEALELATEQTLKDINKWLDDTPRFSEFSSASNSPSQLPLAEEVDGVAARIENEYRARLKLERPIRPKDKMDLTRRRFFKDQGMLKRRREIQRTIDRLQPGKSKGNLISNISGSKGGDETSATGNVLGVKVKDQRTSAVAKTEETMPKLSLGTVLANDVLGLGQHSFNQNSDKKELEIGDDSSEENPVCSVASDEKKPVDVEHKLKIDIDDPPVKKAKIDTISNSDEEKKGSPLDNVSKLEKSTPNLSAWFKAFGAPKSQPVLKKKNESEDVKNSPKTVELIKTNTKEDEQEEEKEKRISVMPPLQSPAKRQRKASTGSSVSERSSFSQDPTDPLADGSSPRPSLDEPYLSPQPDPTKTPYHHSPINGTIRVGFYQDTSFARGSSDKSSSPRELPNCSPREPLSCSPKEPSSSPRDLPNSSPRDPISSPKTDYAMYTTTSIPRYQSSVVTTSPTYESPLSPYPAHMPFYDTSKPLTDQYRTAPTVNIDKPVPSVFPVKKRVYSEIESPQIVKSNSEAFRSGGSFTPTRNAIEQDRGFTPTPGRIPTQPVSRVSDPSHHSYTPDSALAMGLAHHTMSHHLLDPFAEERLLSTSYFGSESIYAKNTPSTTTISHPIFSQSGSVMTTASYNRDEPESAVSFSSRPDLSNSSNYTHVTASSLTYQESRTKVCDNPTSSYINPAIPLTVKTKASTPVMNYSNRNVELLSPCSNRSSASPINFSSNELNSGKVSSPPVNYLSRQELISNKPSASPIGYSKLPSSDLLSGKVRPPSPISFATNRPIDILPSKINSPFRQISELPPPINYNHSASDLSGKIPVPSPLSYPQSDILSGKMNYNHPMTDLMQSPARYNYPMSDLIPGKSPIAYNHPMADLIQSKGSTGYTSRSVDLLTPNVGLGGYNRQISEIMPSRDMTYSSMARPVTSSKPGEVMLSKSTKKSTKKKKSSDVTPVSSSSFQQYLGQSSTEAIALKSTSVVPGSAFNFGPPPLKDSYASYLEDIRSSGYFVPHPEPSGGSKSSSPGPHAPASPFPFLGHATQRGPSYPHPFMNAPYQQYLQRHPEELLRPMVLHQGLLPPTGYPPGYLGMHDAINRSWI